MLQRRICDAVRNMFSSFSTEYSQMEKRPCRLSAYTKLSKVYEKAYRLVFDDSSRIVVMSDCHRGDGSGSDNFKPNHHIYAHALIHYNREKFTYIELGDGDELWAGKEMKAIQKNHLKVFEILADFYRDDRLYMLYGNHDIIKRSSKWTKDELSSYIGEYGKRELPVFPLFPGLTAHEGILLAHRWTGAELLLLHGHQADFMNSTLWRLSRFLVRYMWRPLELIGIKDPASPANSHTQVNAVERRLMRWAEKENRMVLAGHTHRPAFPEAGEAPYFNDGACVLPQYVTAVEIVNDEISLIKWSAKTKDDGVLYVGRDVLREPVDLSGFIQSAVLSEAR